MAQSKLMKQSKQNKIIMQEGRVGTTTFSTTFCQRFYLIGFLLTLATLVTVTAQSPSGVTRFAPLSGDVRIGVSGKITNRSGCGAARWVAAARAVYDVNNRNTTYCSAIGNLRHDFNVSIDFLDNVGDPTLAVTSGLYFSNNIPLRGSNLGAPVHVLLGMTTSDASLASATAMNALNLQMVCYSSTSSALSERDSDILRYQNFFRVCPGDQNRVKAAARFLDAFRYKAVLSVYFSALYTQTMCDFFRRTAESQGMSVASKELPTTGKQGTPPDQKAKGRIREVLREIHDDPFGARVIMLCAWEAELVTVLEIAREFGMLDPDSGYLWVKASDGGPPENGVFDVTWRVEGPKTRVFERDYDAPTPNPLRPAFEYMFNEPVCGTSQNQKCWDLPQKFDANQDYFRYNDTNEAIGKRAMDDFSKCETYTQFGYDAVVMVAAAVDVGIERGIFGRNNVTKDGMREALLAMKEINYGDCLAGGSLQFNRDQERNMPYSILATSNGTKVKIGEVPSLDTEPLTWIKSALLNAECSGGGPEKALKCFNETGPDFTNVPRGWAELCVAGYYFDAGKCVPAQKGYYVSTAAMITQSPCLPGFYTDQVGMTYCKAADIGFSAGYKAQIARPATEQTPCDKGEFASETGLPKCSKCGAGSYNPKKAQRFCTPCPLGTYSEDMGATECIPCPHQNMITRTEGSSSPKDCVCSAELYFDHRNRMSRNYTVTNAVAASATSNPNVLIINGGTKKLTLGNACLPCPPGLECPVGSTTEKQLGEDQNMKVRPGYWVHGGDRDILDQIHDVFQCYLNKKSGEILCPGGRPDSCNLNRIGRACSRCPDGYHTNSKFAECTECGGLDYVYLPIATVLLFGMFIYSHYHLNNPNTSEMKPTTALLCSCGLFVTFLQLSVIYTKLSLALPNDLSDTMGGMAFFTLDRWSFRTSCVLGSNEFLSWTIYCWSLPLCGAVLFFGFGYLTRESLLFSNKWFMEVGEAFNTFCTMLQAVFIPIVMVLIEPLRCFSSPNEKQTMVELPHVVCWDNAEHVLVVVFSIFLFVFGVLGFVSYVLYHTHMMPAHSLSVQNASAMKLYKFIVYRFRAGAWYWGIFYVGRNIFSSLATILDPDDPLLQVLFLVFIQMSYTLLLVVTWPWKMNRLNYADAMSGFSLVMMGCATVVFADKQIDNTVERTAIRSIALLWTVGLVSTGGVLLSCVYKLIKDRKKILDKDAHMSQDKKRLEEANHLKFWAQAISQESLQNLVIFLKNIDEVDTTRLDQVVHMMEIELLGCDIGASMELEKLQKLNKAQSEANIIDAEANEGYGSESSKMTPSLSQKVSKSGSLSVFKPKLRPSTAPGVAPELALSTASWAFRKSTGVGGSMPTLRGAGTRSSVPADDRSAKSERTGVVQKFRVRQSARICSNSTLVQEKRQMRRGAWGIQDFNETVAEAEDAMNSAGSRRLGGSNPLGGFAGVIFIKFTCRNDEWHTRS